MNHEDREGHDALFARLEAEMTADGGPVAEILDLARARAARTGSTDPDGHSVYDTIPTPAPIEGTVLPPADPVPAGWNEADPEGDAPWWPVWIRTGQGRRDRARYMTRRMRRRARKFAARQRTTHGVLPRAVRGIRRTHEWVQGTEGIYVQAAAERARIQAKAARSAARSARFAVLDRDRARKTSERAHEDVERAVKDHADAKRTARKARLLRGSLAYGPVAVGELTAMGYDGWWGAAGATLLTVALAAWRGRRTDLDEAEVFSERSELVLDPGMTPRAFGQMLRDALTEDLGLQVADLYVTGHAWGFEAKVQLYKAKPADVTARLDDLEASLVARPGSLLVQQSAKARPLFTLRALGKDPWRGQKAVPYRAPKSVSVHDRADLGMRLDQHPLLLPFLRTNTVLVGGPGSGKSNGLLDIAEYLTACKDAVVWDIDLGSAGAGLDPLGDAIARRATNKADAKRLLEDALALSVTRPRLFRRLGMGRNWEPSPEYPALVLIIDEYPALVAAGLWDLVAEIIRTGRKSAVNVIMAAQGATKSFLGSADPAAVQTRIALACRPQDVTQLFDGGALGEGWAAHKLRPAEGKVLNDVSVAYVRGGEHVEPIPQRFAYLDDEDAEKRGTERLAAGLVQLDQDSLAMAEVDLTVPLSGGIDRVRVEVEDLDDIDAAQETDLPPLLTAAIDVITSAEATAMTTGELLAQLNGQGGDFADLNPVTLGRALGEFGAKARPWGKGRGVFLADLLAAAGAYRNRSLGA
ncbi:hypothetical protein ACFW1A_10035 [Kitasatospora sp. NPDC058965]|uniref:hypothetical protein n=1 Tax=Kitasatospora sp. NPDC058965 TaxID=3346682 RepID=UPI0036B93D55